MNMKNIYSIAILTLGLVLLTASAAFSQYCVPRTSTTWYYNQTAKTTGAVQNFNNSTANQQGYSDFSSSIGATVKPGSTIKLTVNYYYGMGVWVDWDNNGTFTNSGTERVYVRTNNRYSWGNQDITINVPANAVKGKKLRMRVMTGYYYRMEPCGYSTYTSDVEDYYLFVTYDNNAGMADFTAPSAECKGTAGTDVSVRFRNSGVQNIDTLYFAGEIRSAIGNIKTPIPTKTWSGSVASGNTSNPFSIFTYSSGFKAGDTVCVWSSNPNNIKDSIPDDDTLCYVVLDGMKGKFTVGPDTSHDFPSLRKALDSLHVRGAVCDSVIFCLADRDTAGISYKNLHFIRDIKGTSPTSPIIIRAIDSNKHTVSVVWDSCTEDYNYGFQIENVSDIYFEGINFSANTSRSNGYATVFEVNNSERIHWTKTGISNDQTNSNSEDYALVRVSDSKTIEFDNVVFTNGSGSVVLAGSDELMVKNSSFRDVYGRAISMSAGSDVHIEKCNFQSKSFSTSGGAAIYLDQVNRSVDINTNTIITTNGQWPQDGIYMNACNALNSSSEIYNNMFNLGQPWSSVTYTGINMNDVVGTSLIYNTVAVSGNDSKNAALSSDGGTRNTAFNNVFAAMISGFAISTPVAASIVTGDYNNLYSASGTVGSQGSSSYSTIQNWRAGTGLDLNSQSVNPAFYSVSKNNLHVCNDKLFQAGKTIPGITTDWDGDLRDPNKPCIGADEFAPVSQFSLGSSYGLCDGDTTYLVAGKGLTGEIAIWKNGGSIIDTAQTLMVTMPGKYDVTLLNACGVNADSIEIIAPAKVALGNDTNICPTFTVDYDASIMNGNKYTWSNGMSTPKITISKAGTYYVTTTDMWNCTSTDSAVVTYSNAAKLGVHDTIVCQDAPFGLFGGISALEPNVSYKWFGFDGAATETGDNIFVDYDYLFGVDDTVIVVELTHRGCVTNDSCRVKRKPLPKIDGLDVVVNGLGLYINKNISSGENHSWNFGDSNSSIWDKPRYRYAKSGIYSVTYTNSNICGTVDTTFMVAMNPLSLSDVNPESNMLIYPNPSNGNFNIDFNNLNAETVTLKILDTRGRIVLDKELGAVNGSSKEQVYLNSNESGVYVIQVTVDGKTFNSRVTIQ